MMQQFKEIEKFLKVSPNHAITLTDAELGTNYETNMTNNQLCEKHGSLANLFNQLVVKGITEVHVTPRKKNGSQAGKPNVPNYMNIPTFPRFTLKMQPKEQQAMNSVSMSTMPQPSFNQGLNGLGDVDHIKFKAIDYERVTKELKEVKTKYSKAKKKVAKLERQVIDYEHTTQSKKGLNGVVESVTSSPEMLQTLAGIAEKFLSRGNAPALPSGMSELKQQFMATDDRVLRELAHVASKLNNEDFFNGLQTLLEKY
jgi:hypothetical protein